MRIYQKPNNNSNINVESLNNITNLFNIQEIEEIDKIKECSICIDDYKIGNIIRQLKCSHTFHQNCIDKWLTTNKMCPNCRVIIY
jgi:hypothetical protein